MYTRLLNFLMKHKLLYEYQIGFRHNHSVYMSLIILVDKIITSLDNGDYTIGLFLDFKKAFDTINHDILINKLEMYGIWGTANKWIESYLTDRYQFVEYDRVSSSKKKIICGVPQGSILGPLLFLIFINDLAKISTKLFTLMFTDDTSIFISGNDLYMMEKTLNDEMKKVDTWLKVNKLSLNISKTHFMLFKSNKTAHYQSTLKNLYYTFIYPYITYCIHAWGNACKCYLKKIVTLQKKIVRIIAHAKYNSPTKHLYQDLKFLPFEHLHNLSIGMFMYKYAHNELPCIFKDWFTYNHEIHSYNTRQSQHLHPEQFLYDRGVKV